MVDGIIFDMDGVLLDTETYGMDLSIRLAARFGYTLTPEMYRQTLGTPNLRSKEILQGYLGPAYPYEAVWDAFREELMALAREDRLPKKPGLGECLTGLQERSIPLALATSTPRYVVEVYLEHIPELRGAFAAVVCGTDVTQGKPAPDIFLLAARRLGVSPQRCLGVEDSTTGLTGLKAAGIPSVMIPDLIPYNDSMQELVTYRLSSLEELCPLVDRLR
ncbi:MAG: HAD family phosphatase [Clostridiales bacterium]|nr:HAD family phosphatase [Clostridiales bacterium]